MITLIMTYITNTTYLKYVFLSAFGVNFLAVIDATEQTPMNFYEALVSNTPAQVLTVLGIVAGIIWVLKLADNAWTNHKLNVYKTIIEKEKAEQEEIDTDIKRKTSKT